MLSPRGETIDEFPPSGATNPGAFRPLRLPPACLPACRRCPFSVPEAPKAAGCYPRAAKILVRVPTSGAKIPERFALYAHRLPACRACVPCLRALPACPACVPCLRALPAWCVPACLMCARSSPGPARPCQGTCDLLTPGASRNACLPACGPAGGDPNRYPKRPKRPGAIPARRTSWSVSPIKSENPGALRPLRPPPACLPACRR